MGAGPLGDRGGVTMAGGGFQERLAEFMRGRNGADDLGRICSNIALVLIVVYLFCGWWPLSLVALALIAYAWFRICSKDVAARAQENERFMARLGPARPWVAAPVATFRDRRANVYLTCPNCGQRARVPRGKGRVRIRCRRCHGTYEGRS